MRIRIKKHHEGRVIRVEGSGNIGEIGFNEDLLNQKNEVVSIFFRGHTSSGILDLMPDEIEKLCNVLNEKKKLIKGVKIIRDKK